jgi:hypothetical protein
MSQRLLVGLALLLAPVVLLSLACGDGAPMGGRSTDASTSGLSDSAVACPDNAGDEAGRPGDLLPAGDATAAPDPTTSDTSGIDNAPIDAPAIDGGLDGGFDGPLGVEPVDTGLAEAGPDLRSEPCVDLMDWTQSIRDDGVMGTGHCSGVSVGAVLDQIRSDNPELADVQRPANPDGACLAQACLGDADIKVLPYGDGFRVIMVQYSVFTMMSFHQEDYWYFETNTDCHADLVGRLSYNYYEFCQGTSLWGYPSYYCVPQNTYPGFSWESCPRDASLGE